MKKHLFGFAGRKRSGKTTLAEFLKEEHNAVIITIADYLKYLVCDILNISYEELNKIKDDGTVFDIVANEKWYKLIAKQINVQEDIIKSELFNKHFTTIREILQFVGTDIIRKYDNNWHVKKMIEGIKSYPNDQLIVIDDVRFPNEREAILNFSGDVFFIIRPTDLQISNHISEISLKWQDFKYNNVIINDFKTKERLITNFKLHYNNDFDINAPCSLLLSENKEYLPCSQFGVNPNEDKELLNDILRQIKYDRLFKDYGIIRYKTCIRPMADEYIKKVDMSAKWTESYCNKFFTYNPLITENLKMFL